MKKMNRKVAIFLLILFLSLALPSYPMAQTWVSGKVVTTDGKVATSGVVALEKGELHNNAFVAGGEISPEGTFKIPVPAGGPWGAHVYSQGYLYFPLQIQVREEAANAIPAVLPVDGRAEDNPRLSDIQFKPVSDRSFRITMNVSDPSGDLGPQMLAVDGKRFKAYRMLPASGDLKDKKASFPAGLYVSPEIPRALEKEDRKSWLFVVADHQCSNSRIYNGLNQAVYRQPVIVKEQLSCEIPGIWKSNFDKVYRFVLQSPGRYKGEEFEGGVIVDRMIQKDDTLEIDYRFQGEKGKARLNLICKGQEVIMDGTYTLPSRSGKWVFTKLQNEKSAPQGKELFMANCAVCHYADRTATKVGPGLKGVFKNPKLPATGRPTNEKTVRSQIKNGGIKMPAFDHLPDAEITAIIEYLKTL